jgi:glycosyltransferase involved in cell wall biosynthesis
MNILFIAPLPPPIHGQAYVSNILLNKLKENHAVKVINCTKKRNGGKLYFFKRYFEVLDILYSIWKYRKDNDAVYITISQSFLGNVKDLLTYALLSSKLSKITIHLHGGAIKRELWDHRPFLRKLNKFFLSKIQAAIISGDSHREVFMDMIPQNKIHIIPNFTMDEIFITNDKLEKKYDHVFPMKVLYVSGMRNKKGYQDLLNGYIQLTERNRNQIEIDFAGEFETNTERIQFEDAIEKYPNLKYHGVINDNHKINLFLKSHIFCLPTKYLEGQPISILEAYASGCCVMTTCNGGIVDIFENNINGFEIDVGDSNSISKQLEFCLKRLDLVKEIANANFEIAKKKYKKDVFLTSTSNVILNRC